MIAGATPFKPNCRLPGLGLKASSNATQTELNTALRAKRAQDLTTELNTGGVLGAKGAEDGQHALN